MQMNARKCIKCGENNPVQAAMCWACYTPFVGAPLIDPLTSSSAVPAPVGSNVPIQPAVGLPAMSDEQDSLQIPAWIYAVGGAVVAVLLLLGVQAIIPDETPVEPDRDTKSASTRNNTQTQVLTSSGQSAPVPRDFAFSFVVMPNRREPDGVLGIMPRQAAGRNQASTFARYAARLINARRFNTLHVYVFATVKAGDTFKKFQSSHQNKLLSQKDFKTLAAVWPETDAVCIFKKGKLSKVIYPQTDPYSFWSQLV